MPIQTVKTALGSIEYSIKGKGRTILFIHGGHANAQETIAHQGFDLEKYQLITPSRPGYGDTPLDQWHSPIDQAELLISLLDHLKIGEVAVYGISVGGYLAIALAAQNPKRVSQLILASAVSKDWLHKQGKVYKMARLLFHPKREAFVWSLVRFMGSIFPTLLAKNFFKEFSHSPDKVVRTEDVKQLIQSFRYYRSKEGFMNDIEQSIAPEYLRKIICPTLILHSEYDVAVPLEHAQFSHKNIPHSLFHPLKNQWGHLLWLGADYPETFKIINSFLKK